MMLRAPLEDLGRIAEEYAVAVRICAGKEASDLREEMIRAALPFAGRLARRYRSSAEPVADLEQVARLGLVKAVDRYQPERGSFTAYALQTVLGGLKRHLRDHTRAVHVPRRLQDLSLDLRRAEAAFAQRYLRPPSDSELAELCGVDPQEIKHARAGEAGNRPVSLARSLGDDPGELGDLVGAPDTAVESVPDSVTLAALMRRLPEREQRILSMRFAGNQTQAAIADSIGVSQMQVSRLITRALSWLREGMLTDSVPPWPGDVDLPARFRCATTVPAPGCFRVAVAGEIDRDNAPQLRRFLLDLVARHPGARALGLRAVAILALRVSAGVSGTITAITVASGTIQPRAGRGRAVGGLGDKGCRSRRRWAVIPSAGRGCRCSDR